MNGITEDRVIYKYTSLLLAFIKLIHSWKAELVVPGKLREGWTALFREGIMKKR